VSLRGEIVWDTSEFRRYVAQALPQTIEDSALEALDKAGDDGEARTKQLSPVDTGALQRSVRKEPEAQAKGDEYVVGVTAGGGGVRNPRTGREVDYAAHVEYGTSRSRAQPYLRPGLREAARKVPRYFLEALERRLR